MHNNDQKNKRSEERVKNINIPVRFRADELRSETVKGHKVNFIKKTINGKIIDLSAGGLSLFSELPIGLHLDIGNAINIQFTISKVAFEIIGLVVRSKGISNISNRNICYIAVSFKDLGDREEAIIRKYIQTESGKRDERSQERIGINLKLSFATVNISSSSKNKIRTGIGQVVNLNSDGLCFLSKALFLNFGDNLKIELDMPIGRIDIDGKIRRIAPKGENYEVEVGVMFTKINQSAKKYIIDYIASLSETKI